MSGILGMSCHKPMLESLRLRITRQAIGAKPGRMASTHRDLARFKGIYVPGRELPGEGRIL